MIDEPNAEFFRLQKALAGRYSIERELGRGGMGVVYLAREVSLDRPVALKLLPPALAAEPHLRERFLSEARTAAKLSHPNIVPIYAVDEVAEFVFFAMAYVDGETLGERIRTRGPRPASEVARILREVAWALGYAHGQGVVHRDVKPDNILLESATGRALVADFGIASLAQDVGATRDPARISGTAEFMSPEQARGEPVGAASDIYSLGIVGYYALSGKLPFEASTPAALLAKHIAEPPQPLAAVTKDVPGKLARAIDRCLVKAPDQRFASDAELADAIGQLLDEHRDLPVAVRVFLKRSTRFGGASTLLYLWLIAMVAGTVATGVPAEWSTIAGFGTFIGGVTVAPLAILTRRARRLLESGYGREDIVAAVKGVVDRAREEGAFEFEHGPSRYERVVRYIAAGGLSVGVLAMLASAFLNPTPDYLAMTIGTSLTIGGGAGVLAALRLQRRRDLDSELWHWFWRSRLGRWVFRLAGLGRRGLPRAASATHRPTEQAIGLAADRLFDELPRPLRRALSDLPEVVKKLQADAHTMRRRVEELDAVIAKVGTDHTSRALTEASAGGAHSSVRAERQRLDDELHLARDATKQRLADAVAALETIRLGLLRMQAGAGSVESLTGDLAAAREVGDDIGRLLEGQREVESLLTVERKGPKR